MNNHRNNNTLCCAASKFFNHLPRAELWDQDDLKILAEERRDPDVHLSNAVPHLRVHVVISTFHRPTLVGISSMLHVAPKNCQGVMEVPDALVVLIPKEEHLAIWGVPVHATPHTRIDGNHVVSVLWRSLTHCTLG